jgi:tetratricopeptide (TPR) repeat protein
MPEDPLLEQAITAIRQHDRAKALGILKRLVKADPHNHRYWTWLSTVVETSQEAIYCLQETLKYDPENITARRALVYYGASRSEKNNSENPFSKRIDWQAELIRQMTPPPPPKPEKTARKRSTGIVVLAALVVVAVLAGSIFLITSIRRQTGPTVSISRPTPKASATYLPTATPFGYKPSPTPKGAPPLWTLLKQTYTPTPLYVNTPHPSEAYLLAVRAYDKGDWETFHRYMEQVIASEPNSVDLYYFMGEAERKSGNLNEALVYYEKALSVDKKFSPAILAHAEVLNQMKPSTNVMDDLAKAIEYDPAFYLAYIRRADYLINRGQYDLAMDDLTTARELNPDSPLSYLGLAKVYLAKDEAPLAIENAQKAYEIDITMLDTYLVLGASYIANGDFKSSIEPLQTYLTYQPYDASAYELVGKAYWVAGDETKAMENLEKSIAMDTPSFDAYYIRGVTNLKMGNPSAAFADLTKALQIDDKHYEAVFYRGQALMQIKRYGDSYNQFLRAESLADEDKQRAESIYFQAKSAILAGWERNARDAYKRLIKLPETALLPFWMAEAQAYINPCSGDKCATMTVTFQPKTPAISTSTPTP